MILSKRQVKEKQRVEKLKKLILEVLYMAQLLTAAKLL